MNLKELSDILGLSQTTVSRALNGYPEVAEATRHRIMQVAKQHNYRPNIQARSLATGRAMAIGHVIPISGHHEMVNPIFADFIAGASESYLNHGYHMVLTAVSDDGEEEAYRTLKERGTVDGVIVHGPRQSDPRIALLRDIGMPFVVHGRASHEDRPYNWVDVNSRSAFFRATEFLLDLGHRRIGLINGMPGMDFAARREQGYKDALSARGIALDQSIIHAAEMTETFGYTATKQMLKKPNPPTAFLGASIITSFGIRRAIEATGAQIGRDISVITFDDDLSYLQNGPDVPTFTATRSSVRQAGRICANRVIAMIENPDSPHETHLLEAELTVGRSTGPVVGRQTVEIA